MTTRADVRASLRLRLEDSEGTPLSSERNRAWTPYAGDIFAQTVRTTASLRPSSVLASAALVRDGRTVSLDTVAKL